MFRKLNHNPCVAYSLNKVAQSAEKLSQSLDVGVEQLLAQCGGEHMFSVIETQIQTVQTNKTSLKRLHDSAKDKHILHVQFVYPMISER